MRLLTSPFYLNLQWLSCCLYLGETITAVYGSVISGSERNLCFLATRAAHCIVKFTSLSLSAFSFLHSLSLVSALFASCWFVLEPLLRVKFLFTCCEHKLSSAILANQNLVLIHSKIPLTSWI